MSKTIATKESAPATITLIEGEKGIKKALASIKTRGATLQRDIHTACCSVLAHVGKHKDIRLVTELLKSLPDMTRINAVKRWFESFGPVAWNEEGEIKYAPTTPLKLGDAMGNPFWKFTPETAYKPLVLEKTFDSWIKSLEKDQKETGRDHSALVRAVIAMRDTACPAETERANAPAPRKSRAKADKAAKADAPAEAAPVAAAA